MISDMIANFSHAEEQKLNFGTQIMSSDSVIPLLETPIIVSMITAILIIIPLKSVYECVMCIWQVGFGGVGVDFLAVVPFFPSPDAKIRTTEFKVFPSLAFIHTLFFPLSSIIVLITIMVITIIDAITVSLLLFCLSNISDL